MVTGVQTCALPICVAYGVGIMCVGLIVMHIFPAQLMRMFDEEESLIAIGIPALETISLSLCLLASVSWWEAYSRHWVTASTV